jgi:hypothetical protein
MQTTDRWVNAVLVGFLQVTDRPLAVGSDAGDRARRPARRRS